MRNPLRESCVSLGPVETKRRDAEGSHEIADRPGSRLVQAGARSGVWG